MAITDPDAWEDAGEEWQGGGLNPDRDKRGEEWRAPLAKGQSRSKAAIENKSAGEATAEAGIPNGKPPKPRPQWRYKVVVAQKLHHLHHGSKFLLNGVLLRYQGSVSWSECHHEYLVFPPRKLKQKSGSDPIAVVMALAELLKLSLHDVRCELSWMPTRGYLTDSARGAGRTAVELSGNLTLGAATMLGELRIFAGRTRESSACAAGRGCDHGDLKSKNLPDESLRSPSHRPRAAREDPLDRYAHG